MEHPSKKQTKKLRGNKKQLGPVSSAIGQSSTQYRSGAGPAAAGGSSGFSGGAAGGSVSDSLATMHGPAPSSASRATAFTGALTTMRRLSGLTAAARDPEPSSLLQSHSLHQSFHHSIRRDRDREGGSVRGGEPRQDLGTTPDKLPAPSQAANALAKRAVARFSMGLSDGPGKSLSIKVTASKPNVAADPPRRAKTGVMSDEVRPPVDRLRVEPSAVL